jgi:hypothetical protein
MTITEILAGNTRPTSISITLILPEENCATFLH